MSVALPVFAAGLGLMMALLSGTSQERVAWVSSAFWATCAALATVAR